MTLRIRDIRVPESTCKIHTPERAQGDLERAVSIEGNKVEASLNGTVNEDTSRYEPSLICFLHMES